MSSPDRTRRFSRRDAKISLPVPAPLHALTSPIRWARVATAQARIAADFYQRRDVRDRLIDALMDELDHS
ncbi:MAG: hypothetical protein ACRENS_10190 [Candidatus Eiseniibacteriota bacterium]